MTITILNTGFVTGDLDKPAGFAGEVNAREIEIIHPLFSGCIYEIICKKGDYRYIIPVTDGKFVIPPSLTKFEDKLKLQFIAKRQGSTSEDENAETLESLIFKSAVFTLRIDPSLDSCNIEPLPTYEYVNDLYEKALLTEQRVSEKIDQLKSLLENKEMV